MCSGIWKVRMWWGRMEDGSCPVPLHPPHNHPPTLKISQRILLKEVFWSSGTYLNTQYKQFPYADRLIHGELIGCPSPFL